MDGYLNFYSVSGDGRVTNWTIVKTALWYSDIMLITFSKNLENFSDEIREKLRGTNTTCRWKMSIAKTLQKYLPKIFSESIFSHSEGGRCVTFNPNDNSMFLVGTDEGFIYKCTTEYSSKYLETYPAHNTPIYNIAWNQYVPSVFLTCGAEWMVKIWDHNAT